MTLQCHHSNVFFFCIQIERPPLAMLTNTTVASSSLLQLLDRHLRFQELVTFANDHAGES